MITQQQLIELFDYRDGGLYWKTPKQKRTVGARAGALRNSGYRQVGIDGKYYFEHRLIYLIHHGHLPEYLDHINGDKEDNRIENLRPCTKQQNGCNAKTPHNNTSGIKGVSWHKRDKRWMAKVMVNGVDKHLGYFKTIEKAKEVVDAARMQYHGAFARAA